MNSSTMVWAPLPKSPNCASQQHEGVGALDGVAVLEAHRGVLRQERVVDPEAGLALTEVEQRRPLLRVVLVDEHRVALHERAAAAVLAGEPDRGALLEQRAEGEQLGHRPVDAALVDHLGALVHELLELRVDREALGRAREGLADVDELAGRDARLGGRTHRRRVVLDLRRRALEAGVVRGVGVAVARPGPARRPEPSWPRGSRRRPARAAAGSRAARPRRPRR